jgi:hypothetical protein
MLHKRKYPFDIIDKYNGKVPKKIAKSLLRKYLKRKGIYEEFIRECLACHHYLHTAEDVINNAFIRIPEIEIKEFNLGNVLFLSGHCFTWMDARYNHPHNRDGFWSNLMNDWRETVGEETIVKDNG